MLPVWFLSLYLIAALCGGIYCLWIAAFAFTHRHIHKTQMLGLLMLGLAGWLIFIPVFMLSPTAAVARFVEIYVRYAWISTFAILFTAFALEYAASPRLLKRWLMLGPIVPIGIHLIHWVNPNWMLSEFSLVQVGPYWVIDRFAAGPGYTLSTIITYVTAGVGFVIIIQRFRQSPPLYKKQLRDLLITGSLPMWVNLLFTLKLFSLPYLDWAAFTFVLTAYVLARALNRLHLFNIAPIAYETIVRSMRDPVIVVNMERRVVQMNPAAERLIQRSARSLIGEDIAAVFRDQCSVIESLAAAEDGVSEIALSNPERHYEVMLSTIYILDAPVGRMAILRDITARKQQARERERLIFELDAFAYTVAHNLKNPLSVISGYAGLLQEGRNALPSEQIDLYVDSIGAYSRKIGRIVDELLLLARIRSAEDIPLMPTDARLAAAESIARLKAEIAEMRADIQFMDEAWPLVIGYPPWIEEVWANFISNAIKYGGTPPHVMLGCDRLAITQSARPMIRFWVRDNGAGLTDEQQRRLFKQFTRLEPTRAKGSGLGLTIAQRIVERLNGTVGVISTPGQGSTFYFTLPEAIDPQPPTPAPPSGETSSGV